MQPVSNLQFGGQASLQDPHTGPVTVQLHGTVSGATQPGLDPTQVAQAAISEAFSRVVQPALQAGTLAMPTLQHSMAALIPQIIQAIDPGRMQVQSLDLTVQVPQSATQPAAAAIAAAPSPMESAAQNFSDNVKDQYDPRGSDVEVRTNIGGINVGVGTGGINTDEIASQLKEKAKWKLIGCGIALVLFLILAVIVLIVGWRIYAKTADAMSGQPTKTAQKVVAWDGTKPLTCVSKNMKVVGTTATLASGTAIRATGNCKLTLMNVNVSAPTALSVSGASLVIIEGGSLTGSKVAISALGKKAKVQIRGAKITGKVNKIGGAVVEGM